MKISSLEHETWNIQDASKIQEFMNCPRKYFYHYVLGWQVDEPNIHLIFGESWHRAMEVLLTYGYSDASLQLAMYELEKFYRENFSVFMDEQFYPKTPGFAQEMLHKYVSNYPDDHRQFEVMYTETSGSISIDDRRSVYFRLDGLLKGIDGLFKEKYFAIEHKTASRNSAAWREQWSLKMQVGIYSHVCKCVYGERSAGVLLNGAVFNKSNPAFVRIPVIKTNVQMQTWWTTILRWLDSIENEFNLLLAESEDSPVMKSFPMQTENCVNYMRLCSYHDFCTAWPNPLQRCDSIPSGMKVEYWNPTKIETKNKLTL